MKKRIPLVCTALLFCILCTACMTASKPEDSRPPQTDVPVTEAPQSQQKDFDPDAFAEILAARYKTNIVFYTRLHKSTTYIYFAEIAEPYASFSVIYTDDEGKSADEIKLHLPDGINISYAKIFLAAEGAGSGECAFVVEIGTDTDTLFALYDNFSAASPKDFSYRGKISKSEAQSLCQRLS